MANMDSTLGLQDGFFSLSVARNTQFCASLINIRYGYFCYIASASEI